MALTWMSPAFPAPCRSSYTSSCSRKRGLGYEGDGVEVAVPIAGGTKSVSNSFRRGVLKMGLQHHVHLPMVQQVRDLEGLFEKGGMVLVSGETGCGKTMVLPIWLWDSLVDKGIEKMVACVQSRRVAAIALAQRQNMLGYCDIGFCVRGQRDSVDKKVLYMTDGMLFSEIMRDPLICIWWSDSG